MAEEAHLPSALPLVTAHQDRQDPVATAGDPQAVIIEIGESHLYSGIVGVLRIPDLGTGGLNMLGWETVKVIPIILIDSSMPTFSVQAVITNLALILQPPF